MKVSVGAAPHAPILCDAIAAAIGTNEQMPAGQRRRCVRMQGKQALAQRGKPAASRGRQGTADWGIGLTDVFWRRGGAPLPSGRLPAPGEFMALLTGHFRWLKGCKGDNRSRAARAGHRCAASDENGPASPFGFPPCARMFNGAPINVIAVFFSTVTANSTTTVSPLAEFWKLTSTLFVPRDVAMSGDIHQLTLF